MSAVMRLDAIDDTSPLIKALRTSLASNGLRESTSRFGNRNRLAWFSGSREIAHLHAPDLIDIRLGKAQRQFADDPRLIARPRRSAWVECRFKTPADLEFVSELVALAAVAG
jgi:Family of unknown function (DUF5519)